MSLQRPTSTYSTSTASFYSTRSCWGSAKSISSTSTIPCASPTKRQLAQKVEPDLRFDVGPAKHQSAHQMEHTLHFHPASAKRHSVHMMESEPHFDLASKRREELLTLQTPKPIRWPFFPNGDEDANLGPRIDDAPRKPQAVQAVRWPFFPPEASFPPTPQAPLDDSEDLRLSKLPKSLVAAARLPRRTRSDEQLGDDEQAGIANCSYFPFLPSTGPFAKHAVPASPLPRIKSVDPLRAYLSGCDVSEAGQWKYVQSRKGARRDARKRGWYGRPETTGHLEDMGAYHDEDKGGDQELPIAGKLLRPGDGCVSEAEDERGERLTPTDTRIRI